MMGVRRCLELAQVLLQISALSFLSGCHLLLHLDVIPTTCSASSCRRVTSCPCLCCRRGIHISCGPMRWEENETGEGSANAVATQISCSPTAATHFLVSILSR